MNSLARFALSLRFSLSLLMPISGRSETKSPQSWLSQYAPASSIPRCRRPSARPVRPLPPPSLALTHLTFRLGAYGPQRPQEVYWPARDRQTRPASPARRSPRRPSAQGRADSHRSIPQLGFRRHEGVPPGIESVSRSVFRTRHNCLFLKHNKALVV